jgi:hypothetical protein
LIELAHAMFSRIKYSKLNARQQEIYNFQKVSGILAEYGFATLNLTDDWNGADFLAVHVDGFTVLRVQLKSRLTLRKKYLGRDLWVCFRSGRALYLYPHDQVAAELKKCPRRINKGRRYDKTNSWKKKSGGYSFGNIPEWLAFYMHQYLLEAER